MIAALAPAGANRQGFAERLRREVAPRQYAADVAEGDERVGAFDRAFRKLSPKLRLVAMLALVEDVPYREIADALGIPDATVRVRVFRATQHLRESLKELGAEL